MVCGSHGYPIIPGIAKCLPWRYTTRHLAASLHPAEDLQNPQEARGVGSVYYLISQGLPHARFSGNAFGKSTVFEVLDFQKIP